MKQRRLIVTEGVIYLKAKGTEGEERCFCSTSFDLLYGKWKTIFQKEKTVVKVICHMKEMRNQREVMVIQPP